jgi:ketosteroid isomerase-like protein
LTLPTMTMPHDNEGTVRRMVAAFNEEGFSAEISLAFFAADAVFEEPPEQPAPRIVQGRDEVRRLFNQFDEAWESHHSEPEKILSIDDERVLLLSVERFRGRDGIEITQPSATIFTVRDGKVARMQAFWERARALDIAGLPDE